MATPSKRPHSQSAKTHPEPIATLVRNRGRFLRFLRRADCLGDEPEDLLQDAFVRSLERHDSLRDPDKVVAWFFRILRNLRVDRIRRAAGQRRAHDALRWIAVDLASAPLKSESRGRMRRLMHRLKPRHRDTLLFLYCSGGSLRALAERDGTTVNNAAVRACRARQALRRLCENDNAVSLT